MTTIQIIGIVAVAVLGLGIFYCLYDITFSKRRRKTHKKNVRQINKA